MSNGLITKQDVVNEVRRRKRIGEIPPPYPNGWFALLRSRELKCGASTSVNALGQNFAVFRDETGQVHILDAYCAHLGANLGVGGAVSCELSLHSVLKFSIITKIWEVSLAGNEILEVPRLLLLLCRLVLEYCMEV